MKTFKQFYVWAMNAKFFMALYLVVLVFLAGIVMAIFGVTAISLLSLVEMLGLSIVITILQLVFLDSGTDYSKGIFFWRSICWVLCSVLLTVATSVIFNWFAGLPNWCPYLLGGFMIFGLTAMLIGLKWEQEADTVRLNAALKDYKHKEEARS